MKETIKILKALSDETRLKIVVFLLDGRKCVCEIFPHVKRTQSTVSTQLSTLENAGIIDSEREGKKVFYKIKGNRICKVLKALDYDNYNIMKKPCCKECKK